jgi:hypothetical protein
MTTREQAMHGNIVGAITCLRRAITIAQEEGGYGDVIDELDTALRTSVIARDMVGVDPD